MTKFIGSRAPRTFRIKTFHLLLALILLTGSLQTSTALAAGNDCMSSGPLSGAYTVNVCITAPADGVTVSGTVSVSATFSVAGSNPGVAKLIFYLDGNYLLTDFQTAHTFRLPTKKWVDGTRLLEVEALMKDGFTSQRASVTLTFVNGISQPPVNTNSFTPSSGSVPQSGQPFVLTATGDGASGEANADNVVNLITSWDPNLFLYLGDVYEDGSTAEFYNWYGVNGTKFSQFRAITNPILGNHEYTSGGFAPGYFDYWDNAPRYYSYDAAGWHFIALDSNCGLMNFCDPGEAEYQWLVDELNSHSNVCTLAYFHHPVFNVGAEGYGTAVNPLWSLLAQHGVDIVLTGHDHTYQRWTPLDANGNASASGVTEFVIGGGGHGIQHFATTDPRLEVGFDDTAPNPFGALRLEMNAQGAAYQYINTSGQILDHGSVQCSGTPTDTTPPNPPANVNATSSTSDIATVTWTPAIDNVGVVQYNVYRNGTLLASLPFGTTYVDTTVAPSTTYSYQIRTKDSAGHLSNLSTTATITTPALLFNDGFESGNLAQWSNVTNLSVQQSQVYAGQYAARATSTGSPTYAYKALSRERTELYYRLWFKVISQGANSVYLQRYRTSTNSALFGLYISSTGKLGYRNEVTAVSTTSTTTVSTGSWHELQVHLVINGTASTTQVWLDNTPIAALSKTEDLGNTPISLVQLGDNSNGRTYDIALDRVSLSTNFISDAAGSSAFADVPVNHWAWQYIQTLYDAGITGGCGTSPLVYCPSSPVTRAQMAVFILRSKHGSAYTPPAAQGTVFDDVPASHWAAAWIESLAAEGITGGCGGGNYCPETIVTRDQMAVFLLRTEHGNGYQPPNATGTLFGDVPVSHWAAAWIERLVAEGITAGCSNGLYCPSASVTRDQMAVFLVKTFNLP